MKKAIHLSAFFILLFFAISTKAQDTIPRWKIGDLEAAIRNSDRPMVVNFWATFCKPCIAEIPYFQELVKKYDSAGVTLLLVSLDLPDAYKRIPAFARQRGFTAPIVFLDETNADIFCPRIDAKWSGAIPSSLLINPRTGYRAFYEESLSRAKFEEAIQKMIGTK